MEVSVVRQEVLMKCFKSYEKGAKVFFNQTRPQKTWEGILI